MEKLRCNGFNGKKTFCEVAWLVEMRFSGFKGKLSFLVVAVTRFKGFNGSIALFVDEDVPLDDAEVVDDLSISLS